MGDTCRHLRKKLFRDNKKDTFLKGCFGVNLLTLNIFLLIGGATSIIKKYAEVLSCCC